MEALMDRLPNDTLECHLEALMDRLPNDILECRGWIEIVKQVEGSEFAVTAVKQLKDGVKAAFTRYQEVRLVFQKEAENAQQDGVTQNEFFTKVVASFIMITGSLAAIIKKLFEFNLMRARLDGDIMHNLSTKTCCATDVHNEWKEALVTYKDTLEKVYIDNIGLYCFDLTYLMFNYMKDITQLVAILEHPQNKNILKNKKQNTTYCY